jgi:outer membrane protein OmpA-like peptidoglycan-associated protein
MKLIAISFLFLLLWQNIEAQVIKTQKEVSEKEENFQADDLVEDENFQEAIDLYKVLLKKDSLNPDLFYKLGFCYLNTALEQTKSAECFERSLEIVRSDSTKKYKDVVKNDVFFYLARAYRSNYKFDKSIAVLKNLRKSISASDRNFLKKIDEEIRICQNGLALKSANKKYKISNLGTHINSAYTEHSPVVSADESVLIFTSKRKGSTGGLRTAEGQYYEDIYIATNPKDSAWTEPVSIGSTINTNAHEASIGLSADGQHLFIYKDDNGDGNIYVSDLVGDVWSKSKKLGTTINTKYRETHASVSADGNTLYFTSDRKGGVGGLDIYMVRKLPNGEWAAAENLGPRINTKYDEEGPFIHPDGVTLYFSSKGHNSIGGFDIFKSVFDTDSAQWSDPENLGTPINTPENDVYYVVTPSGKRAYYVSQRPEGAGRTDLYTIDFPDEEEKNLTVVSGYVWICTGVLPEVKIMVFNSETDEVDGIYKPNIKTGRFLFVLPGGKNYRIEYETNGEIFQTEDINIPVESKFTKLSKIIKIKSGKPCDNEQVIDLSQETQYGVNVNGKHFDEQITISNILFAFGKADKIETNPNLEELAKYLRKYPEALIEIGAHADGKGSDAVNQKLTEKRAGLLKQMLVEMGVNPKQLVTKGYGKSKPIAINQDAKGKWIEEAMKFNRRIEFKVLKQGEASLLVLPVEIPDEYKIKPKTRIKLK